MNISIHEYSHKKVHKAESCDEFLMEWGSVA